MGAILDVQPQSWGIRYWFYCPGCKGGHSFDCHNDGVHPSWTFDGNLERPTFSPSLLIRGVEREPRVCHSFVRDGRIEFLGDCTHELAGKTVPLPAIEDDTP